jgi:hypothetical protein
MGLDFTMCETYVLYCYWTWTHLVWFVVGLQNFNANSDDLACDLNFKKCCHWLIIEMFL